MTSRARWHKIQELFEQVIDSNPEERAARLADSCAGDAELRTSVEALLASDQKTLDPLGNAPLIVLPRFWLGPHPCAPRFLTPSQ